MSWTRYTVSLLSGSKNSKELVPTMQQKTRTPGSVSYRGFMGTLSRIGLVVLNIQNFVKDRAKYAGLAVIVHAVLERAVAVVCVSAV